MGEIKSAFSLLYKVAKENFQHWNVMFYVFIVSVAEVDSLDLKLTLQIQVGQTELWHKWDL